MVSYYQYGAYYGSSVSHLVFGIADELAKSNNDHLWCAILGITYQLILELRPEEAYMRDFDDLRAACLRANPRVTSADGESGVNRDGFIKQEDEFRFMLLRHWTLFQSMFHSKYVATRMHVWREKGKRRLETFIVKMGYLS